jgi:hypothetical protein
MGEIQNIIISGFRGINNPLKLYFQKGRNIQSMMIYGRNGSGKSSIVDAWEWLYSGKIQHLAREGAREHAFRHKEANDNNTWIEIEFTNHEIGKIKAEFDVNRVTKPIIIGNLSKLKEFVSFPCHIRYRDLTEFVYETKAEKYEKLSSLMGFEKALDIQNQMQTCSGKLENLLDTLEEDRKIFCQQYQDASGEKPEDIFKFIYILNGFFDRHGIARINEIAEVNINFEILKKQVENDKKSRELLLWKDFERIFNQFYPLEDIRPNISQFQENINEFKLNEEDISKLILLNLYENGIEAIESLGISNICPLCDQPYEGELIEHINSKQSHLAELKRKKNELDEEKNSLFSLVEGINRKIERTISDLEEKELKKPFLEFYEYIKNVNLALTECKDILGRGIESIDKEFDFIKKVDTKKYKCLFDLENKISEIIRNNIENLYNDESRKVLVSDFQQADKLIESFLKLDELNKKISKLEEIKTAFDDIKDDFTEETKRNVQTSFDVISSDVADYFSILERDNDNIGNPKIMLDFERNKAVELEIMFGGESISPAFKFLSESQLNSFGLSIFLASTKQFNPNFKFIILDDIINSFDGHKRPRVIDLLSEHFSDYQILLLTHDSIWLDRLQRSFPHWIRNHFLGLDYLVGPKMRTVKDTYVQIDDFLSEDNPKGAGRTFGVYLELVLQELCENLEGAVKYNRRNEFTLSELFQSFQNRMKKKLKPDHSVVELISEFGINTGFRNYCVHWKEPEIPYSSPEIRDIVEMWKNIENRIGCENCHKFIIYEKVGGFEHISCPCRKLNLK